MNLREMTSKVQKMGYSTVDARARVCQDMDIDFIRYSLSKESIDIFLKKINCIEGIEIVRIGEIEELSHQDYNGKRIIIKIKDDAGNAIDSKIDLGVHKHLEIEQEEYCFDTYILNDSGMRENTWEDIVKRIKSIFENNIFKNRVDKSDKRWIDDDIEVVFETIISFLIKYQLNKL